MKLNPYESHFVRASKLHLQGTVDNSTNQHDHHKESEAFWQHSYTHGSLLHTDIIAPEGV